MMSVIGKNLSQTGFSLTEVLVASLISVGVISASGFAIYTANRETFKASWQEELNREHLLTIQRLKNADQAKQVLGLAGNSEFNDCFAQQKKSSNCAQFSISSSPYPDTFVGNCNQSDPNCMFNKTITYRIECNAKKCSGIFFDIRTELNPAFATLKKVSASPREGKVQISSNLLAGRKQIDFSCTNTGNKFLSSISFDDLEAHCNPFVGATKCANNDPLSNFGGSSGQCLTMEQKNCAGSGLKTIGMFNGQSECDQCPPGGCGPPPLPPPGACVYSFPGYDCVARTKTVTIDVAGAPCPYANGQVLPMTAADLTLFSCPVGACTNYLAVDPGGGTSFNYNGATCYCPAGSSNVGNGESFINATGCRCLNNGIINTSNSCVSCPAGTSRSGLGSAVSDPTIDGKCMCSGAQEYWDGANSTCKPCQGGSLRAESGAGEVVPGTNNSCRCPVGKKWSDSDQKCVAALCYTATITSLAGTNTRCQRDKTFFIGNECAGARCLGIHPKDASWGDGSNTLSYLCRKQGMQPSSFSASGKNSNAKICWAKSANSDEMVCDNSCMWCNWITSVACKEEINCADCKPNFKTTNCQYADLSEFGGGGFYIGDEPGQACNPTSYSGTCDCADTSGCSSMTGGIPAGPPQTIYKPTDGECESSAQAAVSSSQGTKIRSTCEPKYSAGECNISTVTTTSTTTTTQASGGSPPPAETTCNCVYLDFFGGGDVYLGNIPTSQCQNQGGFCN